MKSEKNHMGFLSSSFLPSSHLFLPLSLSLFQSQIPTPIPTTIARRELGKERRESLYTSRLSSIAKTKNEKKKNESARMRLDRRTTCVEQRERDQKFLETETENETKGERRPKMKGKKKKERRKEGRKEGGKHLIMKFWQIM